MIREDTEDRMDPRLAAALAELRREQVPERDWEQMRAAIQMRARPILERKAKTRVLMIPRPLLHLAAAAGIAFVLWMGPRVLMDSTGAPSGDVALEIEEEAALLEALVADVSDQEFRLLVTGRSNPDALLSVAVSQR